MEQVGEEREANVPEAIRMILAAKAEASEAGRMVALEVENRRLARLVGELLVKNQQLREGLKGAAV